MAEPIDELPPTHDDAIEKLVKALINGEVAKSVDAHGATPQEKLRNHMKLRADDTVMGSISSLSTWLQARAADRQATALETLARTAASRERSESVDTDAQAIIDLREPKRDYLATTHSLPTPVLMLLWAMRGMLVDASIKALSKPGRLDPYQRLTTAEIAWSLRLTSDQLIEALPRRGEYGPIGWGEIDYDLLEDFDIHHYGGYPEFPDDWVYGG